jgi:cytochrome c oxidase subunit 2
VLTVSLIVILAISLLLAGAIWHRPALRMRPGETASVSPEEGGMTWLWLGVSLSAVVLLATVVWTVIVLARIVGPGAKPAVTIEVTGRQWWWQVRYLSDGPDGNPARIFATANEIHIPAGEPVRLKLIGGDVIHSFWVPQLAGKMDAIPGQTNETWIEARAPGTWRGQCTEYCGVQHAHMGFVVVADTKAGFARWWAHQLAPAPATGLSGQVLFVAHCGGCHTVRGTDAIGTLGPDLSHLMSRGTIAAGMLPNDTPNRARWIREPQLLKPGVLMPASDLNSTQLADINAYLRTLD